LEQHDTILRSVIEAHDGFVFSAGADNWPRHSREPATRYQLRRNPSERWDGVLARRRPSSGSDGVHTGEAQERDSDYFGPAVNGAARLMAAGHGGQVLVSSATAGVVGTLPPDLKLADLGRHRLRDLAVPGAMT